MIMTRIVFSDFDEFADALRGIDGRFVPTARSESDWFIQVATLGRVDLQELQIGGAATYAGDGTPNTLTLGIPMSASNRIRIDGHALERDSLIYLKLGQPFTFAARETTHWASVIIKLDAGNRHREMFDAEHVMARLDPGTRAQTDPAHLARLRNLVMRINAAKDTGAFTNVSGANAAEQEVLMAVLNTIDASSATHEKHIGRPQVSRSRVISRTLELLEARQRKPLFIDDLCAATEVSERTLRNVFQEYFGVGPIRFLKVRQLLEIRAALLAGDPSVDTVTRIAIRFGIWDFSLFARNYKALYGESPSQTLRRPPRADGPLSVTWIGYAARMFGEIEGLIPDGGPAP